MPASIPTEADVIVVGAGISGLKCAELLQQRGLTCRVLEARGRVGGKILTVESVSSSGTTEFRQDYGAAWINDSTQGHVWKLAKELGLTPLIQTVEGDVVQQDLDGQLMRFPYGGIPKYSTEIDTAECIKIRELIEEESTTKVHSQAERDELDSISLETWVYRNAKGNARAAATVKTSCHAMIGCDPGEVSALFFLDYCRTCGGMQQLRSDQKHGGQHMRLLEGMSALPEGLSKRLRPDTIVFNSPVVAISTSADRSVVKVTTQVSSELRDIKQVELRHYTARKVILSIPTTVYRTITFDPPLHPEKAAYLTSTRYSYYCKYLATFKHPFWRDNGLCGLAQSFIGPVSVYRDTSVDEGFGLKPNYTLTCFIAASAGRKWSRLSKTERKQTVLNQIANLFNNGQLGKVEDLFVQGLESPWMTEKYNGWGCPIPTLPPGGMLSRCWDAFVQPEGNLHFVGNEFSSVWRGYIDGALRTSERAVAEIIADFQGGKTKAIL